MGIWLHNASFQRSRLNDVMNLTMDNAEFVHLTVKELGLQTHALIMSYKYNTKCNFFTHTGQVLVHSTVKTHKFLPHMA